MGATTRPPQAASPPRSAPIAPAAPPPTDGGRALHLIDVENLLGIEPKRFQTVAAQDGRSEEQREAEKEAEKYAALIAIRAALDAAAWVRGDHVRIAANPSLVERFLWDLHIECSVRARAGRHGADHALLDDLSPEFVAERYALLSVASGDGIFTDLVRGVRAMRVPVVVVSRSRSLAEALRVSGAMIVRDPLAPVCRLRVLRSPPVGDELLEPPRADADHA